jgi:hypothetical protein
MKNKLYMLAIAAMLNSAPLFCADYDMSDCDSCYDVQMTDCEDGSCETDIDIDMD